MFADNTAVRENTSAGGNVNGHVNLREGPCYWLLLG